MEFRKKVCNGTTVLIAYYDSDPAGYIAVCDAYTFQDIGNTIGYRSPRIGIRHGGSVELRYTYRPHIQSQIQPHIQALSCVNLASPQGAAAITELYDKAVETEYEN